MTALETFRANLKTIRHGDRREAAPAVVDIEREIFALALERDTYRQALGRIVGQFTDVTNWPTEGVRLAVEHAMEVLK